MASYTMELREYIEMWSQNESLSTRDKIEKGRPKLFDFDYPIFDADYKKVFETHFIRKFYMREIGFETEGLFKFQLENWLSINMPYFNKRFESELLTFDVFNNVKEDIASNKSKDRTQNDNRDVTQTVTAEGTNNSILAGTSNVTTDGTGNSTIHQTSIVDGTDSKDTTSTETDDDFKRQLESNNPDSRLTITTADGEGVIEYASNIKEDNENNVKTVVASADGTKHSSTTDDSTNDTTAHQSTDGTENVTNDITTTNSNDVVGNDILVSTINDIEDYVTHKTGKIGTQTYASMLKEYRQSFLRIENEIFNEMQELFMLVY